MSWSITTAFVNQFNSNVMHLLQQMESRLMQCVEIRSQKSEIEFFDRIGQTKVQKRTARHSDTLLMEVPHDRRAVTMEDYTWSSLLDDQDKIRMLADMTSPYAQNCALAFARHKDEYVLDHFFSQVMTQKEGRTLVDFPSSQIIEHDDTGLTLGKLIKAKEMLDAAENSPMDRKYIVVTARQITNLLQEDKMTNSDYALVKALVAGNIDHFMGFDFIRTELVRRHAEDSDVNLCPCGVKSGMLMTIGKDFSGRIDVRPDKDYATQVYGSMTLGAVRMEEEKIIQIQCHR